MYIPYNDFYKITAPINKIFNQFAGVNRRGYACFDQAGNCFLDASCEDVRAAVDTPFGVTLKLDDGTGNTFQLDLTEDKMLIPQVDNTGKDVCLLPFFIQRNQAKSWALGSIFMNQYYVVYDASNEATDYNLMGIAPRNPEEILPDDPTPGPTPPGPTPPGPTPGPTPGPDDGGDSEDGGSKAPLIIAILVALLLVTGCIVVLVKKRNAQQGDNVVFETYQQYEEFGDNKLNKKGINASSSNSQSLNAQNNEGGQAETSVNQQFYEKY
jgi:hypothetical protein